MGSKDRTVEYLRVYGLDAADVSSDFDEDGYWRLERDGAGKVLICFGFVVGGVA